MKPLPIICLALVFATPAFAAPQSVEDACWRYAQRVTPYLTEREKEAYITNCIADWDGWNTAAPGPQKLLPQQIRPT